MAFSTSLYPPAPSLEIGGVGEKSKGKASAGDCSSLPPSPPYLYFALAFATRSPPCLQPATGRAKIGGGRKTRAKGKRKVWGEVYGGLGEGRQSTCFFFIGACSYAKLKKIINYTTPTQGPCSSYLFVFLVVCLLRAYFVFYGLLKKKQISHKKNKKRKLSAAFAGFFGQRRPRDN